MFRTRCSPGAARRAAVLCSLVILGCAQAPAAGDPAPSSQRGSGILTSQEMEAARLSDGLLLDAVRRLRPGFLTPRGGADLGGTEPEIQVSVNDGRPRPISVLQDMRANSVSSVALLTAGDAQLRFGMRDSFGPVLLVRLK